MAFISRTRGGHKVKLYMLLYFLKNVIIIEKISRIDAKASENLSPYVFGFFRRLIKYVSFALIYFSMYQRNYFLRAAFGKEVECLVRNLSC